MIVEHFKKLFLLNLKKKDTYLLQQSPEVKLIGVTRFETQNFIREK